MACLAAQIYLTAVSFLGLVVACYIQEICARGYIPSNLEMLQGQRDPLVCLNLPQQLNGSSLNLAENHQKLYHGQSCYVDFR